MPGAALEMSQFQGLSKKEKPLLGVKFRARLSPCEIDCSRSTFPQGREISAETGFNSFLHKRCKARQQASVQGGRAWP